MQPFAPPLTSQCCLCGSTVALSGEHKIKASSLRTVFGNGKLVIGRPGESYRHAQSSKSKAFHFSSRVCEACNNARTQPADLAFEEFNSEAYRLWQCGSDPAAVANDPRFDDASGNLRLDVFRYFAKLMCCHLAEMSAPFFEAIADFAIGSSNENYILIRVDSDIAYQRIQKVFPSVCYAAHGGLVITGDEVSHAPTSFYSTLSVGPVRYCYQIRFNELGQSRLMIEHPEFYEWCKRKIVDAIENPISDQERGILGLS